MHVSYTFAEAELVKGVLQLGIDQYGFFWANTDIVGHS